MEARGVPAEAATPRGSARCYQRKGAVVEVSISPIRRCDSRDGHSPTYEECIEAMRAEEERRRCKMTDRERKGFVRGVHAPEYRAELRRLAALDVEPLDEHEGRL